MNKINYEETDTILFEKIIGFKEYYDTRSPYDEDDRELKYFVIYALIAYVKEKYIDDKFKIIGNEKELDNIMDTLSGFVHFGDDNTIGLVVVGFLEGIIMREYINELKDIVKHDLLKEKIDDVVKFWDGFDEFYKNTGGGK